MGPAVHTHVDGRSDQISKCHPVKSTSAVSLSLHSDWPGRDTAARQVVYPNTVPPSVVQLIIQSPLAS